MTNTNRRMRGDIERSISVWRSGFDGLREEDIDELESHLRDELDALAEVGMTGPEATTHAMTKFGPASELVDEMERAAPFAAWRAPAIAMLTGFLVNVLGAAILSFVDWTVIGLGMVLQPGMTWVYLALVVVIVIAPIVTLGGGFTLASRFVARVERMPRWTRIAFVLGMGLFVLAASLPIGVLPVSGNVVQSWAAWRQFTAPARYVTSYALPLVFIVVLMLARRRDARGVVWAVLGYLAKSFGAQLWVFSATLAAWVASHVCPGDLATIERAATMASIAAPTFAVMLAWSVRSRITPTRFARSTSATLAGFALVGGAMLMRILDYWTVRWAGFFHGGYEAMMWSHFGVSVLASLCLAPLAAAGLLRLRSA